MLLTWGRGPRHGHDTDQDVDLPRAISNAPLVKQIACGELHTLALAVDGRVLSWGSGLMGALGTGVSAIASVGQLALAVQVAIGIQKGELDPDKERDDPYGGRKLGELERMLGLMQGNKDAPGGPGLS